MALERNEVLLAMAQGLLGDRGITFVLNDFYPPVEALELLSTHKKVLVRDAVAQHLSTPPEILRRLSNDAKERVVSSVLRNPNCPVDVLQAMVNHETYWRTALSHKSCPESNLVEAYSARTEAIVIVADHHNTPLWILEEIAKSRPISRSVVFSLVNNPATSSQILETLSPLKDGSHLMSYILRHPNCPPHLKVADALQNGNM